MEKYNKYFEQMYNAINYNPIDLDKCTHCYNKLYIDVREMNRVCKNCGIISKDQTIKLSNDLGYNNQTHNFKKINRYDRCRCFEKYIDKKNIFSNSLLSEIKKMFRKIQDPFYLFCPNKKKFFMSDYVIIKCLEILESPQYIKNFEYPCSKLTIKKYDKIWKKITKELDWKFIKTI